MAMAMAMADRMDTSSADGQSPFQGPLTPDDPESLQSSEHICKRMQQMANEKAAAERALCLHLTYLNYPDIQADPVVLQRMENIVRRTSSKVDFIDDQVRLLGSCPVLNCNVHYSNFSSNVNLNSTNLSNSKRASDCVNDGFQYPIKRNTVKSVILNSTTIPISQNKFSNQPNIPSDDDNITPIITKIPPVMV
ncbi:hypothetical protein CDAR_612811 [Caerostris darwini]|uniref:Uncharacterized protein n=1 Tax=Caerostris darwini TaxID=1538125 RepID=A0AAV4UAV3_9ARAC|nr:hypothetical protein CDAR_612811 [Caerostris darwini]